MPMNSRLLRPLASRSLFDADAAAYLTAVQNADNQALEPAVRNAITAFVIGCKQDGIWSAIKASCILMGARTLTGALTPLVGTAPTNNGPFVSGDYDRETGLLGNGTSKYLDTNRNNNADPQNSQHVAVYRSAAETRTAFRGHIAVAGGNGGTQHMTDSTSIYYRSRYTVTSTVANSTATAGFSGISRADGTTVSGRYAGVASTISDSGTTPTNGNVTVFSRGAANYSDARIAFYSVGEALNLALLDARVSTLFTAIGAAI